MTNQSQISNFIKQQMESNEALPSQQLAFEIRRSIKEYRRNGGGNLNALSVDAKFEDGKFYAKCSFSEDYNMTVMYQQDTDNDTVSDLFNGNNDNELRRLAALMRSEGWVEGYTE